MIEWLKQFFCKHEWKINFEGMFTTGIECTKCDKVKLVENSYIRVKPRGWL